ncbi:MAG: tRNA glutamyl-Q(34) synthetase GluQRS [Planctomycetaceae bacterium]|nr:tRNA glutamyl-Q(34) synthetase GluQRS [Planctomycetaceae bacterium]
MTGPVITRFAPSPTGYLHSGHAFSALIAYQNTLDHGGKFLLRLEDIDFTRCREEFAQSILIDLEWLGLEWAEPVRIQSQHLCEYRAVAENLTQRGLLYPCFCTRRDIQREIESAGAAPQGPEGPLYPGTCRGLSEDERQFRIHRGDEYAMRLDLNRALDSVTSVLEWHDQVCGVQVAAPERLGDVVLVRKDIGCSYHLAVVHDDAFQNVNLVTRGKDLFEATHLHRLLQHLLDLPTPVYHHHPLLCDEQGRRLAKRDLSETIRSIREKGVTSEEFKRRLQVN